MIFPTGCAIPHTVFFTDQSTDPDTWSWDFGDGNTSTAQNPVHTYTTTGNFTVRLTIADTIRGTSDTFTDMVPVSIVNAQIDGGFGFFGCGPLTVNFTESSTTTAGTTITGWLWDFGDGNSSTEQNPTHIYEIPGVYNVSLTVTNSEGCTSTDTNPAFVQVIGPNVDFASTTTTIGESPLTVSFQDQTVFSAPIISWSWSFGDGGTSNLQNPSHTYNTNGTFDVSLTVIDIDGCPRTLTKTNFVNTIPGAYDVSDAIYSGNEDRFSAADQETSARALVFNDEGTRMFITGEAGEDINEFSLATAFDISTATYAGDAERFSVAGQEASPQSLIFNTDGTKMFVMGNSGDDINEYHLGTAYDVSTAVFAGNAERFSVASQETAPRSLTFNAKGTKMFVTGSDGDDINEYNLSNPFNVSSATFAGNGEVFSVAAEELFPQSMVFSPSGKEMFVLGSAGDDINLYNLGMAYDVSTAVFAGDSERFSVVSQSTIPTSMAFNNDGTKLFVLDRSGEIYEYSLAAPVITGAVANQAVSDNATTSPFSSIVVQDPNNDNISATITLDDNNKGVLTGTGLTGSGPYTIVSTDAASLQTTLRALVFNPTDNRNAVSETTTFTLTISDGSRTDTDSHTTVISSAVAPTVAISSAVADPTNGAITATFTFSEAVTGFVIGDITVGNGAASNFNATSSSVYTATITPAADGTMIVDVAANVAQDAGGVGNTAATQFSIEADLTAPTVTISSAAADPTNGAITATFTFSEAVTGFAIGDITVGNGAASNFNTTSTSVYTATITPAATGTMTIDVAANVAQDAATNNNTAATQFSIEADLTAPTVTISSGAADPTNGAITATFTFSEAVTGFAIGDITIGNGAVSNFNATSTSVYTSTITPTTDGTMTIDVAENVAQDAATNNNTAATQFSIEADLTDPTVTITSAAADPINGAFTTTFTFSEAVTGFAIGDITTGNGTASNFSATSTTVYTATITPTTDGAVTVDVNANVAQDAATNGNTVATQFGITADLTSPTITISSEGADPTNGAFTTTFTFSEAVTGFAIGDITVGNGITSNFSATSTTVYTATITPTTDGAVTVDVNANVAQDAATNGNTVASQFSITADLTDPTVTISSADADPTNGAITATFTFSEAVTGFAIGDITVGNGTASNFASTSASVYTATITPTTDGAVTIDVAANVAQDAATNNNTAATQFSIEADLTAPSVTITSTDADPANGAITGTFTFSEAVTGFVLGDISVGNGIASNFSVTSTSVYTVTITPSSTGTMTVGVAANVAQDAATNNNTAATQFSIEADLTAPTVTISSGDSDPTNGAITATFTFSETVTGFGINDITVGNGTTSNFNATSTSVYMATITPSSTGTITVDVAANVAQDVAGNANTAATQFSIEADLTAPTVTITSADADPTNGAITATFTFSEAVTGFAIGDIMVGNGTASNFNIISTSVYTATITPSIDGTMTVDVVANVAQDEAGNNNTVATQFSIEADLTLPQATLTSSVSSLTNTSFQLTVSYSEQVSNFALSDLQLSNASASNFTAVDAGRTWTVDIEPSSDGAVSIDLPANVANDLAGNGNTASPQFNITADLTAPTIVITSGANDPTNGVFITSFTFSEAINGFTVDDISVGNGAVSNFTSISTTIYTATITPTMDGPVTIDVSQNTAQDAATNGNLAASQFVIDADFTAPEVTVQNVPAELNTFDAFTLTYLFSEEVVGFTSSDFSLTNATISNFERVGATTYEVVLTATSNTMVSIDLPINSVEDLAGNSNTEVSSIEIAFNSLPNDIVLSASAIDENNALAAEIGVFTTVDADVGDLHTYSLVAGAGDTDNESFSITFDKLRAATGFDFESQSSFNIRVKTDDGKGGTFEKAFIISINDANETPTDILISNSIIEETDQSGVLVGIFSALDEDNNEIFIFELVSGSGDRDNADFEIIGSQLNTSGPVNFEENDVLTIRVRVTDSQGASYEEIIEIAVTNVEMEPLRDFTTDRPDSRVKNFFTPNADGQNDFWVIDDIQDNPVNEVKVFAPGGKLVFSARNYQNDWAGTFNGNTLPSGSYYYEINVFNGQSIVRGILLILNN